MKKVLNEQDYKKLVFEIFYYKNDNLVKDYLSGKFEESKEFNSFVLFCDGLQTALEYYLNKWRTQQTAYRKDLSRDESLPPYIYLPAFNEPGNKVKKAGFKDIVSTNAPLSEYSHWGFEHLQRAKQGINLFKNNYKPPGKTKKNDYQNIDYAVMLKLAKERGKIPDNIELNRSKQTIEYFNQRKELYQKDNMERACNEAQYLDLDTIPSTLHGRGRKLYEQIFQEKL